MGVEREWLTVSEASEELGISPALVRELIHRRELRSSILLAATRKTYRIRRADLDDFRRRRVRDSFEDDWE
jgi:excisionase family DNA binding protein